MSPIRPLGRRLLRVALVGLLLSVVLAGCGGKRPPPVRVKGKVVHAKNPVPWIVVTFYARDAKEEKPVRAGTGADGQFSVELPEGTYQVTVVKMPTGEAGAAGPTAAAAPVDAKVLDKYADVKTTPLLKVVSAADTGEMVLELK